MRITLRIQLHLNFVLRGFWHCSFILLMYVVGLNMPWFGLWRLGQCRLYVDKNWVCNFFSSKDGIVGDEPLIEIAKFACFYKFYRLVWILGLNTHSFKVHNNPNKKWWVESESKVMNDQVIKDIINDVDLDSVRIDMK